MPIYNSSGIAGARMHRSHVACLPFYSSWSPPSCPPDPELPRSEFARVGGEKVPNTRKVNAIVNAALDTSTRSGFGPATSTAPRGPQGYQHSGPDFTKTERNGWPYFERETTEPFHGFHGSPFGLTPRRRQKQTLNPVASFGKTNL
ncbi:unnamed protein product [Symbiodinium sp. CCMP2592]|nr:unnamed protein product [Symbiodinium sp. CCMP2592]